MGPDHAKRWDFWQRMERASRQECRYAVPLGAAVQAQLAAVQRDQGREAGKQAGLGRAQHGTQQRSEAKQGQSLTAQQCGVIMPCGGSATARHL